MNTPVDFPTAKLLKEKGFDKYTLNYYFEDGEFKENNLRVTNEGYGDEYTVEYDELLENWNSKWLTKKDGSRCFGCTKSNGYFETYSAPIIAEVVMWMYEKYAIWINVDFNPNNSERKINWFWTILYIITNIPETTQDSYKSPTEAYEAGIKHVLTELI